MPHNCIRILQWNCNSLIRRRDLLGWLLCEKGIDVACLCETRLDEASRVSFSGYRIVSCDRNRRGGGVAILVSNELNVSDISCDEVSSLCIENGVELIATRIMRNNTIICCIFSLYRLSGANQCSQDFWCTLLHWCSSFPDAVVCGDFNAHSSLWGGQGVRYDCVGRWVTNAAELSDLVCLNDGSHTWSSPVRGINSTPDITFASPAIACESTWHRTEDTYGSDHFPIYIEITSGRYSDFGCRPSVGTGRIDWRRFSELCDDRLQRRHPSLADPVGEYRSAAETIVTSAVDSGASIGSGGTTKKRSPTVWWDSECTEWVRHRSAAFKKYLTKPNGENYDNHKAVNKEVHRNLKRKKRTKFKDFCSSINYNTSINVLWRTIRAFKSRIVIGRGPLFLKD